MLHCRCTRGVYKSLHSITSASGSHPEVRHAHSPVHSLFGVSAVSACGDRVFGRHPRFLWITLLISVEGCFQVLVASGAERFAHFMGKGWSSFEINHLQPGAGGAQRGPERRCAPGWHVRGVAPVCTSAPVGRTRPHGRSARMHAGCPLADGLIDNKNETICCLIACLSMINNNLQLSPW